MLHWRLVRECGYRPRPHLQAFYQGLFWAARISARLAPSTDPLRAAQEDVSRLMVGNQLRQLSEPGRLGKSAEEALAAMLELPAKIDRLLDMITNDQAPLRLRVTEPAAARRHRSSVVTVISLGLVMAAVVLLSTRLGEIWPSAEWVEEIAAVTFLGLGAWLLRAIGRGR